jgi:DtxR family Mn-dependent transcriptional regulator
MMMTAAARETAVSPAMQDYLKAVYYLRDASGGTTVQALASELGVSSPSVTNMVKRLAGMGLIEHTPYQGIALSEDGERAAAEVTRHHRLLEQFLVETLGYGWDEVHAEAERLEHHISEAMEARIAARLGHPERDPHGDPIPDEDGLVPVANDRQLVDLAPREQATVVRVPDRDPARLRYLAELGLVPGSVVTVLEVQPFGGPLRVRVHDSDRTTAHEHHLGQELARTIYVGSES